MKIEDNRDKQREYIVILRCIANGKTAEEIGMLTNKSQSSVKRKLRWWQDKLNVNNNAALVHAGHCHGLILATDDERQDWIEQSSGAESGPPRQ